ncbi:putative nucleic acid-binding protein [Rosa chinensis]|uniref:Putative nucleic acid-binding protein n=1 Tax=Rosa chinensis TaxID=74649 RepID=A0A2P6R3T9_ROSCH|nr:putative nucleic acid-binding protein [Rosa chinensis]
MYCAVDLMKEGSTLTLRNAEIYMFKGTMRLAVGESGSVEVAEPASFTVGEDNLSLLDFKRPLLGLIKFLGIMRCLREMKGL